MTDWIIILVLVVAVLLALKPIIQHFKGEGGCCGGGTYKAKPKKLKRVTATRVLQVEGLHCQNCVNRVMEALNALDGVSANVHPRNGRTVVFMEQPVEDAVLLAAVEKAGYSAKPMD